MPLFFFNFFDGHTVDADTFGLELVDAETAYLEAVAGARSMWTELLARSVDPTKCAFEVTDEDGIELYRVRFAELIDSCHPREIRGTAVRLAQDLTRSANRAQVAADSLARECAIARRQLSDASAMLRLLDNYGRARTGAA